MPSSRPTFAFRGRTIEVDVPHLSFATAIAGWCVWFCQDAWRAQRDVENLILIVPVTAAAVLFYAAIAAGCFHAVTDGEPRARLAPGIGMKIAGTMALLGAYAAAGPLIGFDVATFVYILAMLLFLGERRIPVLVLAPVLFCVIAIWCFGTLLATPLPLLFFGDGS